MKLNSVEGEKVTVLTHGENMLGASLIKKRPKKGRTLTSR